MEVSGNADNESNLQAVYSLPRASNATERGRLDARHKGLMLSLRGLYTPVDKVREALRVREDGRQPAILDVGTGAGNWAEDMAREFPLAKVLGIDLNPVKISSEKPSNCEFQVRDVSKALDDLAERFDVVHVRAVENGLGNQHQSLTNFARLLRPGGILLLASVGMWLYGEDKELLPCVEESDPNWSALGSLFHHFQTLLMSQGREVDAFRRWEGWLKVNPLYQHVSVTDIYNPVGSWKRDSDGMPWQEIGDCFGQNIMIALDYTASLLIQGNYEETTIQRWLERAKQELREMNPKTYLMYRYVSAMRSEVVWNSTEVPSSSVPVLESRVEEISQIPHTKGVN